MDVIRHMVEVSPDVQARIALKNAVGFHLSPEMRGKISSQSIIEIGMPAADTSAKFAALLSRTGPNGTGGGSVASLPPALKDPVLIELGFHILKMPQPEQAGAVQAYIAAGDAHPSKNPFASLMVDVARESGVEGLAYQAIDTLGKAAIRNGESAASIANRLGVTSHEWLLTQLVEQHAAGTMVD